MRILKLCAVVVLGALWVGLQSTAESEAQKKNEAKDVRKLINMARILCAQSYPKPPIDECFDKIFHGMGNALDPHSQYLNVEERKERSESREGRFGGVGMEILKPSPTSPVVVESVIPGAPAERVGIQGGDIITHIDDTPTTSLKTINEAVRLIRGSPNTSVRLTIERRGVEKPLLFTVVREVITIVIVSGEIITSRDARYMLLEVKQFSAGVAEKVRDHYLKFVRETGKRFDGLIITVENNPGGYLHEVIGVVDLFIDAESVVLERNNKEIAVSSVAAHPSTLKTPGDITGGLPMLVVVNGNSASASEIFAGALQHFGRALVAGTSRTFGKGSIQTEILLEDGSGLMLTIAEYLIGTIDNWIPVQCVGITPDVLFEYDSVTRKPRLTECELAGSIASGGKMENAPPRILLKDKNPNSYRVALDMLAAYKAHMGPKRLSEENKLKKLEKEALEALEKKKK